MVKGHPGHQYMMVALEQGMDLLFLQQLRKKPPNNRC